MLHLLNKPLAQNLRKLKPYTALEVWGDINTIMPVTQVQEDDGWGTPDPNQRVDAAPKREFVITGADKNSIDTEVYNRKAMEEEISFLLHRISPDK